MSGTLILCTSPIGNLGDASPRLAEALGSADVVYAEDTRRSRVLLEALGIPRPLRSYFAGNEAQRSGEIGARLESGESIALITDAGAPGISDPGYSAVQAALDAGAAVTVIPGPSAVTAALTVSGLPAERFVFEGFLPRRGGERSRRLAGIAAETRTVVLFAATGRVAGDLSDLAAGCGPERRVVVTRELTKAFEEVWRGTLAEAAERWSERKARGEFTLVVEGAPPPAANLGTAVADVHRLVADGLAYSEAVRKVAADSGVRRRELYEAGRIARS